MTSYNLCWVWVSGGEWPYSRPKAATYTSVTILKRFVTGGKDNKITSIRLTSILGADKTQRNKRRHIHTIVLCTG